MCVSQRSYQSVYRGVLLSDQSRLFALCPVVKKERVSSLRSLVSWYQDHLLTCPHEPQLKTLEPQPGFSTLAIWQCDGDHSFVQYLSLPPRGSSESEAEGEMLCEEEEDLTTTAGLITRRRETDAETQLTGREGGERGERERERERGRKEPTNKADFC